MRDPDGHSFGREEPPVTYLTPDRWRESISYLWGTDLYNHGYLWEAHEAWEGLWHAAKRDEIQASHLQGLIQCAAACLKVRMGEPRGVARLAEAGTGRLERVSASAGGIYMGIDLISYVAEMRAFAASAPQSSEARPVLTLEGLP